jgi:glycyl-tRNA synthetase alpha chain
MYVQNVDSVYDLNFNGLPAGKGRISYGDVFLQAEQEYSRYNFEEADTGILLKRFDDCETECQALLSRNIDGNKPTLSLPAYDQCIKASHTFNLLDARGVISVTERANYIARVRDLAKACCEAWSHTTGGRAS